MAEYNVDWEDLSQSIQDAVERAVKSQDYHKLNQTIRQTVSQAVDRGSGAVRKVVDAASGQNARTVTGEVVDKKELPVLYANTSSRQTGGILKIVFGGIAEVASLGMLATSSFLSAMPFLEFFAVVPGVLGGAAFLGGLGLILSGAYNLGMVRRFKIYRKTLGNKTYCTLEKLARSVGKSVRFVRKELQKMINQGLFLEGHLDKEQTQLITSDETYRYYEQSRLQLEQRKQQAAPVKEPEPKSKSQLQQVLDKGNAFIAEIRRCNDEIPGVEISEKISRMEMIVQKIFDRAQKHPEIIPDLQKLMDYYLPMTVKLLNAYADMDAQSIQGENIQNAKREIEQSLDTLNQAYEKLFDSVFMETALDVSSDISVLHTMLAQEGLTEDELTKMRNKS